MSLIFDLSELCKLESTERDVVHSEQGFAAAWFSKSGLKKTTI